MASVLGLMPYSSQWGNLIPFPGQFGHYHVLGNLLLTPEQIQEAQATAEKVMQVLQFRDSVEPLIEMLQDETGLLLANKDEVISYLCAHTRLIPLVKKIIQDAHQRLSNKLELTLAINRRDFTAPTLTLVLRQNPYQEDITDQIDEMRETWSPAIQASSGELFVMTDLCPPGSASA